MDVISGRMTDGHVFNIIVNGKPKNRGNFSCIAGRGVRRSVTAAEGRLHSVDSVKMLEYFASIPGTLGTRPQYNLATYMLEVICVDIGHVANVYSME